MFTSSIAPGDLDALGPLAHAWQHEGLDTPLVLTVGEFRKSLDTFPLEYQAIIERHEVITGTPPFDGLQLDPRHVRRACEVLAKAHLLHLRQGWLEAGSHDDALAALLVESAGPLRACLTSVARLQGHDVHSEDAAVAGARFAGLDTTLVGELLALDANPEASRHLVSRLPDYLEASRRLWEYVDAWES